MPVAMHILEQEQESIFEMVDTGELRWVWDVSSRPGAARRELRFWLGELMAPGLNGALPVDDVIERVVGHPTEPRLRGTTVCRILEVARPHMMRLLGTGYLKGECVRSVWWVEKASLTDFLRVRLVS
jgi:hypothetical protein